MNITKPNWGKIYVKDVRWENFATGNSLIVVTSTGGTIINETVNASDTDFNVMRFGPFGWVNDFEVTTLSGGNLTVTITKA